MPIMGKALLTSLLLLCGFVNVFGAHNSKITPAPASLVAPHLRPSFDPDWRAFGPLPLGGVGADALSSLRGSIFSVLSTLVTFPSETARGGYATWTNTTSNSTTKLTTLLYNGSVSPLSVWAIGSLLVPGHAAEHASPTYVLLRCSHRAYISATSPDPAARPLLHHCLGAASPCALWLTPGVYKAHLHISSYSPEVRFGCAVETDVREPSLLPQTESVRPSALMHEGRIQLAGAHASVTVHNADETHWAAAGTLRVTSTPPGIALTSHSPHPPRLAPAQTRAVRLDLDAAGIDPGELTVGSPINVTVELTYDVAAAPRRAVFHISIAVLAWPPEVYDATYIDVDGSVQAVALLPPRGDCRAAGGCSALLSTHGAGVDALGDAWTGAYAKQLGAWVLLPTGRSQYGENWEGAQMASALRSLKAIADELPGVPEPARASVAIRKDWALISGHSMGGHGALTLATHFPDLLVAAMPIAGWLRYDTYGQIGEAFHPQLSFSDSALRGLFELSTSEYAADFYSENVLGIPFTARVGSDDKSVPPTNLRKFCRLVREYELYNNISTSFVTLNEVPGKGHWFRGVMDDGTLQPFLASALALTTKPKLPSSFSIFTINPATTGSRGGLRILQLHTPFESSRIGVTMSEKWPSDWHLKTRNVHRFRFRAINGVHPRPNKIYVDDNAYALTIPRGLTAHNGTSPNYADFCRISAGIVMPGELKWKLCNDRVFPLSASLTRGPDTSGPLTQVISGLRVSVIYPAAHKELLGLAVRYANALHSIGLAASVKPDSTASQLVEQGIDNFVLLGGSGVNAVSTELQRRELSAEVRTDIGMICVGGRCTRRPGAGIAFLAPGRFRRLVVVIAGTDMTGLDAAAAFLPLSPEQKTPEWVLVQAGDGFGWRGYGAVEAAGYWDSEWRIDPRRTYPADWALPRIPRQRGVRWSRKFMLVFAMIAVAVAIARLTMGMPPEEGKTSCNNVDESKAFFMVEDAANGTTSTCSAAQLGDSS